MKSPSVSMKTKVELKPLRSQIFVILTALMAFVFFIIACLFSWFKKKGVILPILGSIVLILISLWAYFKTYLNAGLDDAAPLNIALNGLNLRVDSKLVETPENLNKLIVLLQGAKELPAPAGLVTDDGAIIPNSKGDAINRVNIANASIHNTIIENVDRFNKGELNSDDSTFYREPPQQKNQKVIFTDIADAE